MVPIQEIGWSQSEEIAQYREMFEIVLFYQALWAQTGESGRIPVLGGIAAGLLALGLIGFALFKYSVRLPIGPFFAATSVLIALLAVVFTGHGIAALQEAGVVTATRLGFDPLPVLGIYATSEGLGAQALALAFIVVGFVAARRSARVDALPAE